MSEVSCRLHRCFRCVTWEECAVLVLRCCGGILLAAIQISSQAKRMLKKSNTRPKVLEVRRHPSQQWLHFSPVGVTAPAGPPQRHLQGAMQG